MNKIKNTPEERISDKFRNNLSVFLFFNELGDFDFEQKDFILYVHDTMNSNFKKMTTEISSLDNPMLSKELNKLAIPILILSNYIDNYKSKEEVIKSRENLDIEETVNIIIELLK